MDRGHAGRLQRTTNTAAQRPRAGRRLRSVALVMLGVLVPAASAGAHGVTPAVLAPATAPVEDSGFSITFAGDPSSLSDGFGYIRARIRPAGGPPCAPTEDTDYGDRINFGGALADSATGPFRIPGTYVAGEPGDYLVCAWIQDALGESGPPGSAAVTVRPAMLRLTASAPASARRGAAFAVTVGYLAEVPRYLSVLVVRASSCSLSGDALYDLSADPVVLTDDKQVSGIGSVTGTVRLQDAGTYLVCAFLDENSSGSRTAQLVARVATITVGHPAPFWRACGAAGGRRHIRDVRAHAVSCAAARTLARRWGARRRAPARLGSYRCAARSGNVTCTAGTAQVRFGFRRTAPR